MSRTTQIVCAVLVWALAIAVIDGARRGDLGVHLDAINALKGHAAVKCGTGGGLSCFYTLDPKSEIETVLRKELLVSGWRVTEDSDYVRYSQTYGHWVPDRGTVSISKRPLVDKVAVNASFGHVSLWLAIANVLLFAFHTALILFNVFGWLAPKWRRWNLITLGLTLFSWAIMGIWQGMGYCICTDLHWRVRGAMGIQETADSYLVLLVRLISGWDPPVALINKVALGAFFVSIAGSVTMNLRDWRRSSP